MTSIFCCKKFSSCIKLCEDEAEDIIGTTVGFKRLVLILISFREMLEALSVLMLCAPSKRQRPFSYHTKMADFEYFRVLSEKCIEYGK